MPGHVKLGAQKGEDPDPEPYLCVSMEMKREDMQMPYDSKKSFYCPDGKGGHAECILEERNDKESHVLIGHIVSIIYTLSIIQSREKGSSKLYLSEMFSRYFVLK